MDTLFRGRHQKPPRNEMPAPGDKRLKAYEQQREMDRAAMLLVQTLGLTLEEAYKRVYIVPLIP